MEIKFTHHEGSQAEMPLEEDTVSSPTVVYLRRNIQQVERTDEMDGRTYQLWEYDEAEITPEEYRDYQIKKNTADIEFIAVMSGLDL